MPDSVDALETRAASTADAPVQALEDVMFPALPKELGRLNDFAAQTNERDVKARLRATAILVLKQQGYNRREIGRMCGMTPNAVRVALWRARSAGRLNDLRDVLQNDSMALAIEGLNYHLKKKDKDAIFKTLEGLGEFKSYNNNKNDGAAGYVMPALTVTIVNAPNQGGEQIVSTPVGSPRIDKVE